MSRFRKLSHTLWYCQYPIVGTPKYRFRILTGPVGEEINRCIRTFCEQLKCEVVELNVQTDPAHRLVMIPPKVAVSDFQPKTTLLPRNSANYFKLQGEDPTEVCYGSPNRARSRKRRIQTRDAYSWMSVLLCSERSPSGSITCSLVDPRFLDLGT
jgi:REP element-mobilizing transposase RayT